MTRATRPRVLVAPITVSPTKPLTPTHTKYLLIVDVLCRATGHIADLTYVYDHHAFAPGQQTVAFWEYLDRTCPDRDFTCATEEEIGELYVRYHAEAVPAAPERLRPYAQRVRDERWLHPSAVRMLDIWQEHYIALNLFDTDLGRYGPPVLPEAELIDLLAARHLCIDGRPVGAPVYLDLTAQGIPLRGLVNAAGQANYLMCVLGQLIPLAGAYDLIVLMYDRDMREDYVLVERVLRAFGGTAVRFEVDRVPIDGVAASSRYGGWRGYTLDALRSQVDADPATLRLALRLYLIGALGRGRSGSFRLADLHRWVNRARRLCGTTVTDTAPLRPFLENLARGTGYVDPYRLTAQLLTRSAQVPRRQLLASVYP
jgi:hypothetical protein